MDIQALLRHGGKTITDNSPSILTAMGVTGTLTTAYLTGKASAQAVRILQEDSETAMRSYEPTWKDDARLVWKLYIPAAGSAVLTISSIILANRIGSRRAAAVATAFSISEKTLMEYKDKVTERLGEKKAQEFRDSLAQDRVNAQPLGSQQVIVTGGGQALCFDEYSGRYFSSDMESLKKAQNDINYDIINHDYATLTEFYSKIGLPRIAISDDVGWNTEKLLELEFAAVLSDDNRPCISVGFRVDPIRRFHKTH